MKQASKQNRLVLISILSVLVFLIAWEVIISIFNISRTVLVKPTEIIQSSIINSDIILKELLYTITEIVPGWLIGNILGFIFALLIYRVPKLSKSLVTTSVFINSVPLIALTAIIGGIMGTNKDSKILIVSLIVFFPMFISTLNELTNIKEDHEDLLISYSATKIEILSKILIPKSLPNILSTLKVNVITAIFTAITSEFFGGYGGIGIFILSKKGLFNLELVWASIFFIAIFGCIFYFLVEFSQKKFIPWQES